MVSSLFQILLGFTGLVGFLLRFIGPLSIAPTITLVGVALVIEGAERAGKTMYLLCCAQVKDWYMNHFSHFPFYR